MTANQLIAMIPTTRDPDLYQDMVVAVLTNRPATETEARTVIRRVGWVHDRARHAAKRRTLPIDGVFVAEQPEREHLGAMYALIDQLPDHHRIVLTLAYVEGLTDTEIASRLGVTTRIVYRHKAAAIAAAREAAHVMFLVGCGTEP